MDRCRMLLARKISSTHSDVLAAYCHILRPIPSATSESRRASLWRKIVSADIPSPLVSGKTAEFSSRDNCAVLTTTRSRFFQAPKTAIGLPAVPRVTRIGRERTISRVNDTFSVFLSGNQAQ